MTQIASLLAVATAFIGLWTIISTFYSQEGGDIYERQNYLHVCRNFEPKVQGGGLCVRGGVIAGFYDAFKL